MGEDEDEIRLNEEGSQLMRSEEEEKEKDEEEEEKEDGEAEEEKEERVPWKSLEGDDVMSRLFDWDFDQLLRQVSLS